MYNDREKEYKKKQSELSKTQKLQFFFDPSNSLLVDVFFFIYFIHFFILPIYIQFSLCALKLYQFILLFFIFIFSEMIVKTEREKNIPANEEKNENENEKKMVNKKLFNEYKGNNKNE